VKSGLGSRSLLEGVDIVGVSECIRSGPATGFDIHVTAFCFQHDDPERRMKEHEIGFTIALTFAPSALPRNRMDHRPLIG
jgi:hypothetical protein